MELLDILECISVINRDNGKRFTQSNRLDAISSLLWNSNYRKINSDGLFNLYSKKPIEQLIKKNVIVVSSHIDCEKNISHCFTSVDSNGIMRGTYDNSITNAAILSAMLSDELPDNVLISFTGDEEVSSKGAIHTLRFLQSKEITIKEIIVLDVTDVGWNENIDFTIENNFWNNSLGKKVIDIAENSGFSWLFVPCDVLNIPNYVPYDKIVHEEAAADESWDYDEEKQTCFCLCLPVNGNMHSDKGVLARKRSFYNYSEMLLKTLKKLSEC